jgi:hypothetical protein
MLKGLLLHCLVLAASLLFSCECATPPASFLALRSRFCAARAPLPLGMPALLLMRAEGEVRSRNAERSWKIAASRTFCHRRNLLRSKQSRCRTSTPLHLLGSFSLPAADLAMAMWGLGRPPPALPRPPRLRIRSVSTERSSLDGLVVV